MQQFGSGPVRAVSPEVDRKASPRLFHGLPWLPEDGLEDDSDQHPCAGATPMLGKHDDDVRSVG